jgi:hypothetical protein
MYADFLHHPRLFCDSQVKCEKRVKNVYIYIIHLTTKFNFFWHTGETICS